MKHLLLAASLSSVVDGHGAMVSPLSRNAIGSEQVNRCANGMNVHDGQSCYWYSQGCFIGCPTCDSKSGRVNVDLCGLGKLATNNDPFTRTVNRNATAGSKYDIYKHNPWRAPGSAPVVDACGLAGGTPWQQNVSEWGDYVPTPGVEHGHVGSTLPERYLGVQWALGGEAEVAWQTSANHGGGYQYRLCPLSEPPTEACFQKHPLEFVREKQQIAFTNGTRVFIKGTFVDKGTLPEGSTWAMNPIPPTWLGPRCIGPGCKPGEERLVDGPCEPCPGLPGSDCSRCDNNANPKFPPPCGEGKCQGNEGDASVIDVVKVPADLAPGRYVLGWRLDCESTAQVWNNCADIMVVKAAPVVHV